ncbi:MAG: hypothetical protein JNK25_13105 [Phycisphaerae bacterium]|nr:hypothetical protein [Phycisphaerae bacterium]
MKQLSAVILSSLLAGTASAQVSFYDLFYYGYTSQYDDNPPPPATLFSFASRIFCTEGTDIGSAEVRIPGRETPQPLDGSGQSSWVFYSVPYASIPELFDVYPTGVYEFHIEGGTLGDQQASIDRQVELFPPEPPAFTDGTVPAMQAIDASQDFIVRFTPFDVQPGGNVALTYLSVYTLPDFLIVHFDVVEQPATEFLIPGGALPPGADLAFYLTHSSRLQYADGGFGTGEAVIGFDLNTYAPAYTLPDDFCPADFNQDGGVDGADVDAFFAAWEAGEPIADVNQDGGVDGADVDTFFAAWEAGGCG